MKTANSSLKCCFTFCHSHLKDWIWFLARIGLKLGIGIEFGKVQTKDPRFLLCLGGPLEQGRGFGSFLSKLFFLTLCWFLLMPTFTFWNEIGPRPEFLLGFSKVQAHEPKFYLRKKMKLGVGLGDIVFYSVSFLWKLQTHWEDLLDPLVYSMEAMFCDSIWSPKFLLLYITTIFNKKGRVISLCHTS